MNLIYFPIEWYCTICTFKSFPIIKNMQVLFEIITFSILFLFIKRCIKRILHISSIKIHSPAVVPLLFLYIAESSRTLRSRILRESHLHISYAAVKHPSLQAALPPLPFPYSTSPRRQTPCRRTTLRSYAKLSHAIFSLKLHR